MRTNRSPALCTLASVLVLTCAPACAQPVAPPPAVSPSSFADVFARVSPAVVSITVTMHAPDRDRSLQNLPFPFNQLPQFGGGDGRDVPPSRRQGGAGPDAGNDTGPEAQAAGSGFFISSDGYIVTNNHVAEGATRIAVTLSDGRELPARLIGRDEATDLAVIKVEGAGFAHVNFETQVRPRVGDWVMAVGNPLGLGGTATAGIVSYVGREVSDLRTPLTDFLQISAPITFGNSGGPTFDALGRVVGVNAAIAAQGGAGGGGIGFAIPADVADGVVRQLMTGRPLRRGYLGATIQGLDAESGEALGLPVRTGAQVAALAPGGPAAAAGLQVGDIILSLNGRPVISSGALTRMVSQAPVGDTLRLGIRRQGRDLQLSVRAGVRPSEEQLAAGDGVAAPPGSAAPRDETRAPPGPLGLNVSALTPQMRAQLGVAAGTGGVLIEDVRPGSAAANKGLRPGDVVRQVNQQPVLTSQDFAAAVEAVRRKGRRAVFLLVMRDGRAVGLAVEFPPTRTPAP